MPTRDAASISHGRPLESLPQLTSSMDDAKAMTKAAWVSRQVEQLLETYFMNVDNTYNKLQTLGEYIDDTEDYIQFDLDTKRNKFIEVRCGLSLMGGGPWSVSGRHLSKRLPKFSFRMLWVLGAEAKLVCSRSCTP